MPKPIVDQRHPDVQELTRSTVNMCLDTINNPDLPDMSISQRATFVQHVNRLLENLTSRTSYVIHSHYHEDLKTSGPENVELVARMKKAMSTSQLRHAGLEQRASEL